MTDAVALTSNFKDVLREKILTSVMDLIPEAEVNKLIDAEVKTFFETEALLTIEALQVEIVNPNYNPNRHTGYGNEYKIKRDILAFGSKMTPFRQLVWSTLHQHLLPKVKESLEESLENERGELNAWFAEKVKPDFSQTASSVFNSLSLAMAATMQKAAMESAMSQARYSMISAFESVGLDTSKIPLSP